MLGFTKLNKQQNLFGGISCPNLPQFKLLRKALRTNKNNKDMKQLNDTSLNLLFIALWLVGFTSAYILKKLI